MAKAPRLTYPRRGEVYLVNFEPTIGAEIKKTRPALILQNEAQSQRTNEQAIAYGSAVTASIISALLVTEYYRIPNFVRKRKFLKTKMD